MKKNYYNILGLTPKATLDDIKKAYRKLVHKYHPDIAGNDTSSVQRFKEITEAYETLSSPQKRERYDEVMKLYEYDEGKAQGKNDRQKPKKTNQFAKKADKDEDFQKKKEKEKPAQNTYSKMHSKARSVHAKNIFSDALNNIFKGSKQKKYTPPKVDGKDITAEVTLTVEEAINGTERVVNILHLETCEKCKGRKFINGSLCSSCGGAGEKSKYKKLTVKIPARVHNDSKVRVEGEGNKGFNGGKNGNLYLIVKIENNIELEYDGLNILRTVSIEPFEAALGGYIEVNMPDGALQVKLMPSTRSGQKYRIAGQGLEKDGGKGDLIITVKIDIPRKMSNEELALYEKLKQLSKRSIREPANE